MDKDLKRLINETIAKTFAEAPEKMVQRGIREIEYDICPHCKTEIYEKHEYTEDGGVTWRHSDCKGLISRPDTPLDEIASWLRPYVAEAQKQRHDARKALGLECTTQGFAPNDQTSPSQMPPSGEKKYNKQQPGGEMGAANTTGLGENARGQELEAQTIQPRDDAKFAEGSVRVQNISNVPLNVTLEEFVSTVEGVTAKAYIIKIANV